nr:cupin domain-containing protein [uncultured Rhodoferax sp.]
MSDVDSPMLSQLLTGISVSTFFEEFWQRKPLHARGATDRFSNLFDKQAFHRATRHCDHLKISSRDIRGVSMERACSPDRVEEAFRSGSTVCISGIQDNAQLNQFMAAFASELHQAGELSFNCYYSPNGHGFSLHLDDHPVWILQIEGKKRWWYSKVPYDKPLSTVSFPLGAMVAHVPWAAPIPRPDESEFFEVVLEPGDVLYLPEGSWHRAAAEGESLALTLACSRISPLDLVQQVMAARIAQRRLLRENLPGAWAPTVSDTIPGAWEAQFAAVIDELRGMVNGLTPQDMYEAWRRLAAKDGAGH